MGFTFNNRLEDLLRNSRNDSLQLIVVDIRPLMGLVSINELI